MLTYNIWTERGLVNGSRGILYSILQSEDASEDPLHTRPICLLVQFPDYKADAGIESELGITDRTKILPIFLVRRLKSREGYTELGETRWRFQFPLIQAEAITVHRSQGLTVKELVLDLSL